MRKRLYLFILICWLAGVFCLLWFPLVNLPDSLKENTWYDKGAHLVFFGIMEFLVLAIGIRWQKFRFSFLAFVSLVAVTMLNLLGEYVQSYIPGRVPSYFDFISGLAGAIIAVPITYMIFFQKKRELVLHICCAPCATSVREVLDSGYKLTFYFYNPNIHPASEYDKRLAEVKKLAKEFGIKLIIGKYDESKWRSDVSGLESQPEGGLRCEFCFRNRLKATAVLADRLRVPLFATTLTVSPHKNSGKIIDIGNKIGIFRQANFLDQDFKENNGWPRSLILSKEFGFYRQKYCGCEFSKREADSRIRKNAANKC